MSDDGAHLGITANRALGIVLGGEPQPEPDEGMTPAQMRVYLESGTGDDPYSEGSRRIGQAALALCDAHPQIDWRGVLVEDTLDIPPGRDEDWDERWKNRVVRVKGFATLWQEFDHAGYRALVDDIGPTGFMFGWAVNAARYALDLPPVPNPAILTVGP